MWKPGSCDCSALFLFVWRLVSVGLVFALLAAGREEGAGWDAGGFGMTRTASGGTSELGPEISCEPLEPDACRSGV